MAWLSHGGRRLTTSVALGAGLAFAVLIGVMGWRPSDSTTSALGSTIVVEGAPTTVDTGTDTVGAPPEPAIAETSPVEASSGSSTSQPAPAQPRVRIHARTRAS